jgi:hypothetical protein
MDLIDHDLKETPSRNSIRASVDPKPGTERLCKMGNANIFGAEWIEISRHGEVEKEVQNLPDPTLF